MCLAIPARIIAIDPATDTATVALGAVTKEFSLALMEDAAVGDYVLVHVGYALNRISAEEAEQTLALMREAGVLEAAGHAADGMKYVDEFRDQDLARGLAAAIAAAADPGRHYRLMEFCGGHTHAIFRYGVAGPDAAQCALHPWPRLPGLRPAHGAHRPRHRAGRPAMA